MRKILIPSALFVAAALFASCNHQAQSNQPDELASHIDTTVKPGEDFFMYANGNWFKQHPIPASEQSNGLWQLIQDTINAQIKDICESSAALKTVEKGSNKQKIGDFFFTGMDSLNLNKKGISDLKPELDMIDGIKTTDDVMKASAYIQSIGGSALFDFGVEQDDKISNKTAVFFSQGGLSLPDRTYYVDNDSRTVMIRGKFVDYTANMFKILGYDEAKAKSAATSLMKLETAMAKVSRKREDTRDPIKNYNKMTFSQLKESAKNMNYSLFIDHVGLHNVDTVIVGQPEYLTSLNGYIKSYSIDDWKNYLKFHLINATARYMDDKTYIQSFDFYTATLRGVKEPKLRWKRVIGQTDNSLGELIGQVYVAEYLPKGTKEKLQEIGTAIKDVYAERIKNLDWMSPVTKEKALEKLNTIVMKVGYPDKWKDLSSVKIDRSSYLRNVINTNKWQFDYMISKFGKPVDRTEWSMEPQTYNAYYNPSNNEIVVPGCNIIVPGFERKLADDAILYSVIGGSTFGHEITHGFDDQGSKYNQLGNLTNWWTPSDSAQFYGKTKMIVSQFNKFIAVDSLHINGSLTQGENIADLGGVIMGYQAFKKTEQYKNKQVIGGLNPDQRFFLGYAFAWMINERPEAIANQVKSNEHSPAKFRVLGPLANMPEFYSTFGIKKGDKMFTDEAERVEIW
jgi:putative endopeptidase